MPLFYTAQHLISNVEVRRDTAAFQKMHERGEHVTELQADGPELEMIREQFSGIRMHNGSVVEWFGDDARFIAMHLKLKAS